MVLGSALVAEGGNAKTTRNTKSRFGKCVALLFALEGAVGAATISTFLLASAGA